jgi:hypothetical protein
MLKVETSYVPDASPICGLKGDSMKTNYLIDLCSPLVSLLMGYLDTFAKYSMEPPQATPEQYGSSQESTKVWLADNRLRMPEDLFLDAHAILVELQRFIICNNQFNRLIGKRDPLPPRDAINAEIQKVDGMIDKFVEKIRQRAKQDAAEECGGQDQ